VDRFTRWPEAIPIPDMTAATVCRTFLYHWIARFGAPQRITSDQGRQFVSTLFRELAGILGSSPSTTCAYHPAANGMVERLHRQLKAALTCHNSNWTEALPLVLLGIRSAWKDDLGTTSATLVYGEPIRLPGEFFAPPKDVPVASEMAQALRSHFTQLRPAPTSHGRKSAFVFKDLATTPEVFIRRDALRGALEAPCEGPFPVEKRADKYFTVKVRGNSINVSVDRLKPAYTLLGDSQAPVASAPQALPDDAAPAPSTQQRVVTRSGRKVRFTDFYRPS